MCIHRNTKCTVCIKLLPLFEELHENIAAVFIHDDIREGATSGIAHGREHANICKVLNKGSQTDDTHIDEDKHGGRDIETSTHLSDIVSTEDCIDDDSSNGMLNQDKVSRMFNQYRLKIQGVLQTVKHFGFIIMSDCVK